MTIQKGIIHFENKWRTKTHEPIYQKNYKEMVKMTATAIDVLSVPNNASFFPSPYLDLQDANQWYYSPAKNLLYLDYGDGIPPFSRDKLNFYPDGHVTRAQLKVILEAWNVFIQSGNTSFTDDNNHYLKDYIYTAAQLGIINTNQTTVRPEDFATQTEIFQMLYNTLTIFGLSMPNITTGNFSY